MSAYFASLRVATNSAAATASRAASETYDSARGQDIFLAHQHKPAGVKTKQRRQRLIIIIIIYYYYYYLYDNFERSY